MMMYGGLSGDGSPLYQNQEFAEKTDFGRGIAYPMLAAAMAGGAIARLLPTGSFCRRREFTVCAPFYVGDTVTVTARLVRLDRERREAHIELAGFCQRGEQVFFGSSREELVLEKEGEESR